MAYELPKDIIDRLQEKYPDAHISQISRDIITEIVSKTLRDGATVISSFGRFISYKTFSKKMNKPVIRFKFQISRSLDNKIKNDTYLLEHIPAKAKSNLSEVQKKILEDKKHIRDANVKAQRQAIQISRKKTMENINMREVIKSLDVDD